MRVRRLDFFKLSPNHHHEDKQERTVRDSDKSFELEIQDIVVARDIFRISAILVHVDMPIEISLFYVMTMTWPLIELQWQCAHYECVGANICVVREMIFLNSGSVWRRRFGGEWWSDRVSSWSHTRVHALSINGFDWKKQTVLLLDDLFRSPQSQKHMQVSFKVLTWGLGISLSFAAFYRSQSKGARDIIMSTRRYHQLSKRDADSLHNLRSSSNLEITRTEDNIVHRDRTGYTIRRRSDSDIVITIRTFSIGYRSWADPLESWKSSTK